VFRRRRTAPKNRRRQPWPSVSRLAYYLAWASIIQGRTLTQDIEHVVNTDASRHSRLRARDRGEGPSYSPLVEACGQAGLSKRACAC
jgi:hypothetical protein